MSNDKRDRPIDETLEPDVTEAGTGAWTEAGARAEPGAINFLDGSIHQTIQQQVAQLLDDADIDEASKQQILASLSCPCCGGGGMQMTIQLGKGRKAGEDG